VPSSNAGRDPRELAELARTAGLLADPVADVAAALDQIAADRQVLGAPRILIVGSLYLAGTVLATNGTPPA
jgi:dihydrofolate synthase/folylpolyglutamate synthase